MEEAAIPYVRDWLFAPLAELADASPTSERHAQGDAERRVAAVVEAMPSGLLVLESDGTISLANAACERLFASPRSEFVGKRVQTLMGSVIGVETDDFSFLEAPRPGVLGAHGDILIRRRDGSIFPAEIVLTPINSGAGVATLAVLTDITLRRLGEAALKTKSEELERSNADLEQFAYVASHDLQEPLRMVASYTQLLADKYAGRLDDQADRYIGYAVDGARRMQDLVRDLLSYSRVTASPKPLQPVGAHGVVMDVLSVMGRTIEAAEADITVEPLPAVIADAAQLRHVFLNLIGNALKFRSEAPARIRVRATRSEAMTAFCVEDNGIGIDPRHAQRIFQMFQRLHERGKYEGSGIGLTIVKKIVERHGGRVWIESDLGKGAKVHFTLPDQQ